MNAPPMDMRHGRDAVLQEAGRRLDDVIEDMIATRDARIPEEAARRFYGAFKSATMSRFRDWLHVEFPAA